MNAGFLTQEAVWGGTRTSVTGLGRLLLSIVDEA